MSELDASGLQDDPKFGLATLGVESFHRALQAALHSRAALDLGQLVKPTPDPGSPARIESDRSPSPFKIPSGRLTLRKLHALQALTQASPPAQRSRATDPN